VRDKFYVSCHEIILKPIDSSAIFKSISKFNNEKRVNEWQNLQTEVVDWWTMEDDIEWKTR